MSAADAGIVGFAPGPAVDEGTLPADSTHWLGATGPWALGVLAQFQLCHSLAMDLVWAIGEPQGTLARPCAS